MTRPLRHLRMFWPGVLLFPMAATATAQRPWVTAAVWGTHDDQPRDALHARIESGGYFGKARNATLAVSIEGSHLNAPTSADQPNAFTNRTARLGLTGTLGIPAARLGISAEAGGLFGAPDRGGLFLWSVRPNLGLGRGFSLRGAADQDRYTAAVASLDTVVLRRGLEVGLDRSSAPGWAGAAWVRRDDYGDDNAVTTIAAWVLAPLSRSMTHSFRVGYAVGWQDADRSRWVPRPTTGGPPGTASGPAPGRYDPYYTPQNVLAHSAVMDVAIAAGTTWLKLTTAIGIHATEIAPEIRTTPGGPNAGPQFVERSFRPWRLGGGLAIPMDRNTALDLSAEYQRTAYWQTFGARIAFARSL